MPKKEHLIEVIVIPPPIESRMIKAGKIKIEPEVRPAQIIREVFAGSAEDFLKERYPMVYDKSGWRGYIISDRPLSELEAVKPKQESKAKSGAKKV